MKRLCPFIFLNFIVIEMAHAHQHHQIKNKTLTRDENSFDMINVLENREHLVASHKKGAHLKVSYYSPWGRWGECRGGRRERRRHCIQREVCGDAVRIEVARCKRHGAHRMKILTGTGDDADALLDGRSFKYERRQLNSLEVQKRFIGFSSWGPWSSCSRKCTTVRRRYCQKKSLCGQKVIRQSAYCYLEGSYCQRWIRTRMQRRKNPGYGYRLVESMSPPAPAIHPEDSRLIHMGPLDCGRLGHLRGSASQRMRARMRDMMRIIGGRPAPPGKWPWQVVVLNRFKEAFCGGTLVSLRWVVTAAHCVRKKLYVRLGEHDLLIRGTGELEMRVTEAVVHPHYDPDTVVNDVALLRLPAPARLDMGHGIACLPHPHQLLAPHTTCTILGWGKKRPTDIHGTRLLHEAQVSTIQQGVCRRSYWQYAITDNMVCAGRGRRDSCAGDSGGPLLCRDQDMRYYLQGITSFGDGCGKRGKYGIYTRTAGYVDWMKTVMRNKYFD